HSLPPPRSPPPPVSPPLRDPARHTLAAQLFGAATSQRSYPPRSLSERLPARGPIRRAACRSGYQPEVLSAAHQAQIRVADREQPGDPEPARLRPVRRAAARGPAGRLRYGGALRALDHLGERGGGPDEPPVG